MSYPRSAGPAASLRPVGEASLSLFTASGSPPIRPEHQMPARASATLLYSSYRRDEAVDP